MRKACSLHRNRLLVAFTMGFALTLAGCNDQETAAVGQTFGSKPTLVEPVRTYVMRPGDVHLYDVGMVHSPKREAAVKLIRIENQNLDHMRRSKIKAVRASAPAGAGG